MAANVPNPNQPVLDEIALIPAVLLTTVHNNTRNRMIALGHFNAVPGGTLDRFLVGAGAIYSIPTRLAESSPNQIDVTIKDHNKTNPGFATAINSDKASFLHAHVQMWRGYQYGGQSMNPTVLANTILLTTEVMINGARQRLQYLLSLEKQVVGTATTIRVGIHFNGWLLSLRTILSGIVGSYWETIVYLTCPFIIDPAN